MNHLKNFSIYIKTNLKQISDGFALYLCKAKIQVKNLFKLAFHPQSASLL